MLRFTNTSTGYNRHKQLTGLRSSDHDAAGKFDLNGDRTSNDTAHSISSVSGIGLKIRMNGLPAIRRCRRKNRDPAGSTVGLLVGKNIVSVLLGCIVDRLGDLGSRPDQGRGGNFDCANGERGCNKRKHKGCSFSGFAGLSGLHGVEQAHPVRHIPRYYSPTMISMRAAIPRRISPA